MNILPEQHNALDAIKCVQFAPHEGSTQFRPMLHTELIDAVPAHFYKRPSHLEAVGGVLNCNTAAALIEFAPVEGDDRLPSLVLCNDNTGRHSLRAYFGVGPKTERKLVPFKFMGMRHTSTTTPERFITAVGDHWDVVRPRPDLARFYERFRSAPKEPRAMLANMANACVIRWTAAGQLMTELENGTIPRDASALLFYDRICELVEQASPYRVPEKKYLATRILAKALDIKL